MTKSVVKAPAERTDSPVVLIVEDDIQLQSMLQNELMAIGFDVLVATGEKDVRRHLDKPNFDLVILDLALDGNPYKGFEFVRDVRKARSVPIIVVSGHSKPWDRLKALELGIDDYITKPFLIREVELRLKRYLKLYRGSDLDSGGAAVTLYFSGLVLDTLSRTVRNSEGSEIPVTGTEFEILKHLLLSAGRILTRDELWRAIRGQEWSPLDRALDGHIARLRQKLEPEAERPGIIKSVRGIGYVLAVPVSRYKS